MGAARECWRWGASLLLADSFPHLAATALLFAALALHAETRYGTLRVLLLAAVAGLGGNFFDGLASGLCRAAIAGAAVAFGLLPLFAADHALNFETIRRALAGLPAILLPPMPLLPPMESREGVHAVHQADARHVRIGSGLLKP